MSSIVFEQMLSQSVIPIVFTIFIEMYSKNKLYLYILNSIAETNAQKLQKVCFLVDLSQKHC